MILISLLFLCSYAAAGVTLPQPAASPATDLQPPFNIAPPYLGADIATSVVLGPSLPVLWLHGDTLVGSMDSSGSRVFSSMPRNSIALRYSNGSVAHFIRPASVRNRAHVGFFTPPESPAQWYWPTCGVVVAGHLFVFSMRIAPGPPGLFPFVLVGTDVLALGGVDALGANPLDWPAPAVTAVPYMHENLTLGNALGTTGSDYVYMLGGCGDGGRAGFMTRLPLTSFPSWGGLEYFAGGAAAGGWEAMGPGVSPLQLFDSVPSEATLTYHPSLGVWVILRVNTFLGHAVTMLYAPQPEGPWLQMDVYAIPQEQLAGGVFCYAGKVHPELSDPSAREIVFTYMCNTPRVPELLNRTDIYIPQVVRLAWGKLFTKK